MKYGHRKLLAFHRKRNRKPFVLPMLGTTPFEREGILPQVRHPRQSLCVIRARARLLEPGLLHSCLLSESAHSASQQAECVGSPAVQCPLRTALASTGS